MAGAVRDCGAECGPVAGRAAHGVGQRYLRGAADGLVGRVRAGVRLPVGAAPGGPGAASGGGHAAVQHLPGPVRGHGGRDLLCAAAGAAGAPAGRPCRPAVGANGGVGDTSVHGVGPGFLLA